MAIRRSIAPGCPTLLEPGDDSDDSAADFSDASPAPSPNSATPAEQACSSPGGGGSGPRPEGEAKKGGEGRGSGGSQGSGSRLQTLIHRHPSHRTRDRTPTFGFSATPAGAGYLCKLDHGRYKPCRSPFTTHRLTLGRHVFAVKARTGGEVDPSPATFGFRVVQSP